MPQVTVYIREDDLEAWRAIEKKSEFIHQALRGQELEVPLVKEVLKEPEVFVPKAPDPVTGYPCCLKSNPCKHWSYDGNKQMWINSLTGGTKVIE